MAKLQELELLEESLRENIDQLNERFSKFRDPPALYVEVSVSNSILFHFDFSSQILLCSFFHYDYCFIFHFVSLIN